ncbi:unnamed protein product [Caretta caretta]
MPLPVPRDTEAGETSERNRRRQWWLGNTSRTSCGLWKEQPRHVSELRLPPQEALGSHNIIDSKRPLAKAARGWCLETKSQRLSQDQLDAFITGINEQTRMV